MPGSPRRFHVRRLASTITAAAALSAGTVANATLTVDLRCVDSPDPKLVHPPLGTTDFVLHFDVYAVVTGSDAGPANEGLNNLFFSVVSSDVAPTGLNGNLIVTLAKPFDGEIIVNDTAFATGYPGTVQDLDGDGDLDVGSSNIDLPDGWVYARATSLQTGKPEFLVAHATSTPTAPYVDGETDIAIVPRPSNGGVVTASWQEDGLPRDSRTPGSFLPGAPVVIAVPEPVAAAIACPVLLMLARRLRPR